MVFLIGVKIFGHGFAVLEQGKSAECVLAGVKKIEHGFALVIKCKSIVDLHPSGNSAVVSFLKKHLMSVSGGNDGLASVLTPDGRICDTENFFTLQPPMLGFDPMDFTEYFVRMPFQSFIRYTVRAVKLKD